MTTVLLLSCCFTKFGCNQVASLQNHKEKQRHELFCGYNVEKLALRRREFGGIVCRFCNSFALDHPKIIEDDHHVEDEEDSSSLLLWKYTIQDCDQMMKEHVATCHNNHNKNSNTNNGSSLSSKTLTIVTEIYNCMNPHCCKTFYDLEEIERHMKTTDCPFVKNDRTTTTTKPTATTTATTPLEEESERSSSRPTKKLRVQATPSSPRTGGDQAESNCETRRVPVLLEGNGFAKYRNRMYSCCYRDHGCKDIWRRDVMEMHIKTCGFCPDDRNDWISTTFGVNSKTIWSCQVEDCKWILNDRQIQTASEAHARKERHAREYHPESSIIEQRVEEYQDGKLVWACGYERCKYFNGGKKDSRREARNHMKSCGYDNINHVAQRMAAHDGLGVCTAPGCNWVAKSKSGSFKTIQNIKAVLTRHEQAEHSTK